MVRRQNDHAVPNSPDAVVFVLKLSIPTPGVANSAASPTTPDLVRSCTRYFGDAPLVIGLVSIILYDRYRAVRLPNSELGGAIGEFRALVRGRSSQ